MTDQPPSFDVPQHISNDMIASRPAWHTVAADHRVLAVARTLTSLNRILDLLLALADDPRIEILFTIDDGSEFSDGVADHIRKMGGRIISWSSAAADTFNLAIAASDNSDLHLLTGPLLLLPHGAGFHKYSPHSDTTYHRELSGLTR